MEFRAASPNRAGPCRILPAWIGDRPPERSGARKVRTRQGDDDGEWPPAELKARDSATENEPPNGPQGCVARVKRCGKSAPLQRRRWGHGKPHRVQAQAALPGNRHPWSAGLGRVACFEAVGNGGPERNGHHRLRPAQDPAYFHDQRRRAPRARRAAFRLRNPEQPSKIALFCLNFALLPRQSGLVIATRPPDGPAARGQAGRRMTSTTETA